MLTLGVDIGGTAIKAGIADQRGALLYKTQQPVAALRAAGFIPALLDWMQGIADSYEAQAIGIGVPGLRSRDGRQLPEVPNLPELEGGAFLGELYARFAGLRVQVQNDANAAAWGAYRFCPEIQSDTFGYLTLGTGVGSAVIAGGQLYTGGKGNGPELGVMDFGGMTLEDRIGREGLLAAARAAWGSAAAPQTPEVLCDAAARGEVPALEVLAQAGQDLGRAIAIFVQLFDITEVYIGGGMSPAWRWMAPAARQVLDRMTPYHAQVQVREASLGNDAGILGAAALGM
ncbi:MAG: ROK family protein [Bacteroidia bacterium]|nr:ROK family protein [Bacteroidia bacterium]